MKPEQPSLFDDPPEAPTRPVLPQDEPNAPVPPPMPAVSQNAAQESERVYSSLADYVSGRW